MDNISFWNSYGLSSAPFEDQASHLFHCPLPQWQDAFHALHRLVVGGACSEGQTSRLALIVGSFGTGKSVLLSQFLSQVESSIQCCPIRGNPSVNFIDLSLALATRFKFDGIIDELRQADIDQQLALLTQACSKRPQHHHLLIIDEAHRLPAETLSALLRLDQFQAAHKQCSLSIVLAGDIKLKARLSGLSASMSQIWVFELTPLDKNNTKMYLDYRMKRAGWIGTSPFDEAAVVRIHRLSGGIPGRINRVAEQVLIQCLVERENIMDPPSPPQNPQPNDSVTQPYTLSSTRFKKQREVSYADAYLNRLYIKTHRGFARVYESFIKKQAVTLIGLSFLVVLGFTFSSAKLFTDTTFSLLKSRFSNNRLSDYHARSSKEHSLSSFYPTYGASTLPSIQLVDLPRLTRSVVAQKKQQHFNASLSRADQYLIERDEQAILSQDEGYAVQLMAMPDINSLMNFLKKQHLFSSYQNAAGQFDERAPHIFKGLSQHHFFYGLVYGPFETWGEAQAWVHRQPISIRILHPWIRSIGSIKRAIEAQA